ncbi:hypothetical protein AC578_8442 [Pseudocercospora eumusae]|uniref:Peptide hydrolase n=1 Tax=Pseudocercospora eumusae TaxID=321146 RepID=A0A139H1Y6_9PEZI|nr:hypothetical protein AC578_8442 [Pseudocercospora eumusae]KXS96389.1 hypothetical protein AC578_8442 [Pseudocercospora eumusae]KXS96390.1 hypothetical protein AC578_8442 [Pseudocercospora eumusae]KXS96393.1 hypothetical protein AC578_8442 [Pseudocercospora eumusae]KXS96394.1 hypothetical protein AC578_8442 [Pseudocercospora eumusae]
MVRAASFFKYSALVALTEATFGPIEARQDSYNNPIKPKVDSKKLQASIKEAALAQKAKELEDVAYSTPDRNRVFSSPGHNGTLEFIEGYLDSVKDYYTYERQEFIALYSQASGSLIAGATEYPSSIYQYSPSTDGTITAPIVEVQNLGCNETDYPDAVSGAIALISRGECTFGTKSALAGSAGAVGAIIYNNVPGPVSGGTLGAPPNPVGDYIPSAGVSQENGTAILEALQAGAVEGQLEVDSVIENRTTYNIIADTIGGDKSNVVAVGAHSDSVFAGPGINDDGSGTIAILETAIQLASYSTKNAIRFCFWSAEEFGLLGSEHYVTTLPSAEADKIKLYLNYDMVASPNFQYALYDGDGDTFNITGPPGSAEIENFFEDWFAEQGIPTKATAFDGRSDYGPFLDAGIPAGGIFTGAEQLKTAEEALLWGGQAGVAYDPNYHQAGDNYTNLNFEAFLTNTKAIAASIAHYGSDLSSIPPRNSTMKMLKTRGLHHHPHAKRNKVHTHENTYDCGAAPKVFS